MIIESLIVKIANEYDGKFVVDGSSMGHAAGNVLISGANTLRTPQLRNVAQ